MAAIGNRSGQRASNGSTTAATARPLVRVQQPVLHARHPAEAGRPMFMPRAASAAAPARTLAVAGSPRSEGELPDRAASHTHQYTNKQLR